MKLLSVPRMGPEESRIYCTWQILYFRNGGPGEDDAQHIEIPTIVKSLE